MNIITTRPKVGPGLASDRELANWERKFMTIDGSDFALGATLGVLVVASISRHFFAKEEKRAEEIRNSKSSFPGWEKGKFLNVGKSDYLNEASGVYSPPIPPDPRPSDQWSEYTQAGYAENSLREVNYNAASMRTTWYTALQWGSLLFFAVALIGNLTS